VMIAYAAHPWSYAGYRLLETMLGVVVAWGIRLVPRLVRVDGPETPEAKGP